MRRLLVVLLATLAVLTPATAAWAGAAHFVDDKASVTVDGATLTATFKEAGLGDEDQVHIVLSAVAACVNPGGNSPQAANKQAFTAEGLFPVQHGSAEGSLRVSASFQPECVPPMSVAWSNAVLTDTTSGISVSL